MADEVIITVSVDERSFEEVIQKLEKISNRIQQSFKKTIKEIPELPKAPKVGTEKETVEKERATKKRKESFFDAFEKLPMPRWMKNIVGTAAPIATQMPLIGGAIGKMGSALGGLGGALGGALGAASGLYILEKIFDIIKGIFNLFMESSEIFRETFKLIRFSFLMLIRPIADAFAMAILPFLILFIGYFLVPFYTTVLPIIMVMSELIKKMLDPIKEFMPIIGKIAGFLMSIPIVGIMAGFLVLAAIMRVIYTILYDIYRVIVGIFNGISNAFSGIQSWFKKHFGFGEWTINRMIEGRSLIEPYRSISNRQIRNATQTIYIYPEIYIGNVSSNVDLAKIESTIDRALSESIRRRVPSL